MKRMRKGGKEKESEESLFKRLWFGSVEEKKKRDREIGTQFNWVKKKNSENYKMYNSIKRIGG